MVTTERPTREVPVRVKFLGGNWEQLHCTDPEILVEGGNGTGKTVGILHRMNLHAQHSPGYRGAIIRQQATRLADTVLNTFQENVLHEWDWASRRSELDHVKFFGGSRTAPESYEYENGSRIVVGGMDNPSKILGAEYDEIFFNQCEEGTLDGWETLGGRLRHVNANDEPFIGFFCLIGDCNPSYDTHWLLKRAQDGKLTRIRTTLHDNPAYWAEKAKDWTPLGKTYLARLENMTGSRRERFLEGKWVGMENAIYADLLDAKTMFVPIPETTHWTGRGHIGIDYGETHSHPSTVVALTESTSGVWWVRKCWAAEGGQTKEIEAEVLAQKTRFGIKDVMTGPDVQPWAQSVGWRSAQAGAGSRGLRIGYVTDWLSAKMLKFDHDGEGMQELWDEMHMYRREIRETDIEIKDVLVRKGEDRVSGLEYAVEAEEAMPEQLPGHINLGGPRRATGRPQRPQFSKPGV